MLWAHEAFHSNPVFMRKKFCQRSNRRQLFLLSSPHLLSFAKYESFLCMKSRLWTCKRKALAWGSGGRSPILKILADFHSSRLHHWASQPTRKVLGLMFRPVRFRQTGRSRHRCDFTSELNSPGSTPRRWVPPRFRRFGEIMRV